jgi:ankyrin repeat protein/WD40 repeat protein
MAYIRRTLLIFVVLFTLSALTITSVQAEDWIEDYGELDVSLSRELNPPFQSSSVVFSPDGRFLASGDKRSATGVMRIVFQGDTKPIGGGARIWSADSGDLINAFKLHEGRAVSEVRFTPDSKALVTGGYDGRVIVTDVESGETRLSFGGTTSYINSLAVSPDGRRVVFSDERGSIRHRGIGETEVSLEWGEADEGHKQSQYSGVSDLAYSSDGQYLASAGYDGAVLLWNTKTNKLERRFKSHSQPVRAVALSPDGQWAASGGQDHAVYIHKVESGYRHHALVIHSGAVTDLAFSPDGRWLASGSRDGTVHLLDPTSGGIRETLSDLPGGIESLAFSPDSTKLAISSSRVDREDGGLIQVWSVNYTPVSLAKASFVHCDPGPEVRFDAREKMASLRRTAPPRKGAMVGFEHAWMDGDIGLIETYFRAGMTSYFEYEYGNLIHRGVLNGWPGLLEVGLECGLDVNRTMTFVESYGKYVIEQATPLHLASVRGHTDLAKTLVRHGAKVDLQDGDGQLPLHRAANQGNAELVTFLIENGAEVNVRDNLRNLPLHYAARYGHRDVVGILGKQGSIIDERNRADQGPLFYAVYGGHLDSVKYLVAYGANIHIKDNRGVAPLHEAVSQKHFSVTEYLLEQGAYVDETDTHGRTPLHRAVVTGQPELVDLLLAWGATLEASDVQGQTHLHFAVRTSSAEITRLLIRKGADVNVQDADGATPLHLAKERLRREMDYETQAELDRIIKLLERHGAKP